MYIFPNESRATLSSCYHVELDRLFHEMLPDSGLEESLDQIVIESATYCKKDKSPHHEFIWIRFRNTQIPDAWNYMVVDRNKDHKAGLDTDILPSLQQSASVSAMDEFRISCDGNINHLLTRCRLAPCTVLETITFPQDNCFPLYELAAIALTASLQRDRYHLLDANCYWFAGIIWECIIRMRPKATHQVLRPEVRGRFGSLFSHSTDLLELQDLVDSVQELLSEAGSSLVNPGEIGEPPDLSRRFLNIFPPGFDGTSSSSSIRKHYSIATGQLFRTLTQAYVPEHHVESTIVTSAWYGRQKNGAGHAFILIEVEDTENWLRNYMVLDRNDSRNPPFKVNGDRGFNLMFQTEAADAFRVAYDGREKQLLEECLLWPRRYFEKLDFNHGAPLFLYQLATLVLLVSESSPNYGLMGKNDLWFAGVIWECIRTLCPSAQYIASRSGIRGRFATIRYTPDVEHISRICQEFKHKIESVEDRIASLRQRWHRMERMSLEMAGVVSNNIPGAGSPLTRISNPVRDSTHFGGDSFNETAAA